MSAVAAPHEGEEEPVYPGTCRTAPGTVHDAPGPAGITWRFRVPQGEEMAFCDGRLGLQRAVAGRDFGDFVVWRKDDIPAYQLAVVADDAAMRITEVVRGEDLLMSTFRQLLLYRALGLEAPASRALNSAAQFMKT
jgi:glutamyl-tRNA synthetase